MTAHELAVYCRSWGGSQLRLATTQAWMAANWSRAKRMPNLARVLDRIEAAERRGKPKRPEDWTQADLDAADARVAQAALMMAAAGKAEAGEPDGER